MRESTRAVGDYTISFRVGSGVKHFKIISHEYGDYFIADNRFDSLSDVVEFYMNQVPPPSCLPCSSRLLPYSTSKPVQTKPAPLTKFCVLATLFDPRRHCTSRAKFHKGTRLCASHLPCWPSVAG